MIPNLPPADPPLKPYDTLLVNEYISHGFAPSRLDAFFQPMVATESPIVMETSTPPANSLQDVASAALQALNDLKRKKAAGEVSV